jgi:hypothetical protein
VYANLHQKEISPYGFKYDPKKNPITFTKTYLLIANSSDSDFGSKIAGCKDFLNQAEKKLRLIRTDISCCQDPPTPYKSGVYLFRGSGIWMTSPPLLSLYSLFIRLGFCHKEGDNFKDTMDKIQNGSLKPYQHNDKTYLTNSRAGIDAIFSLGYRKFFYKNIEKNYPNSVDISTLHNSFGIVGFTYLLTFDKKPTPFNYKPSYIDKVPKYWHRKSIKKFFDTVEGK